MVIIQKNAI